MNESDEQHLNLLSIFHYIVAASLALCGSIPIIHVCMGLMMILASDSWHGNKGEPPPPFIGWMFTLVGAAAVLVSWTFAVCIFLAGRFLAQRKHYMFCMVMAGVSCMYQPLGTILGVFTIIVLLRPSVKEAFAAPTAYGA